MGLMVTRAVGYAPAALTHPTGSRTEGEGGMRNLALIVAAIGCLAAFAARADDALDAQLLAAAKTGTPQQVQDLIQRGANIEARAKNSWTPLRVAVAADNT